MAGPADDTWRRNGKWQTRLQLWQPPLFVVHERGSHRPPRKTDRVMGTEAVNLVVPSGGNELDRLLGKSRRLVAKQPAQEVMSSSPVRVFTIIV